MFQVDASVEVVAEGAPSSSTVCLPNTEAGVDQLAEKVGVLRHATRPAFFCFGTAPGVELEGTLFEALVGSDIPRFILAHNFFVAYCERTGVSSNRASSLLAAFRESFPAVERDA